LETHQTEGYDRNGSMNPHARHQGCCPGFNRDKIILLGYAPFPFRSMVYRVPAPAALGFVTRSNRAAPEWAGT